MFSIIVLLCRAIGRMIKAFPTRGADASGISHFAYEAGGIA